jgi:hypothetical protein
MSVLGDESHEEEAVMNLLGGGPKGDPPKQGGGVTNITFGVELTNSPSKRGMGLVTHGIGVARTSPSKLARR